MLTLFVLWELHTDEPMLDIRFFRNRSFSTGSGGMMLVFLAMYGVMFLMTQYFQLVLGYSPFSAAVRFLPMAPIMIIVAPSTPLAERSLRRQPCGRRRHVADRDRASCSSRRWACTPGTGSSSIALIPLTSGMAMSMSPMTAAIMSAVPLASCRRRFGHERRDT